MRTERSLLKGIEHDGGDGWMHQEEDDDDG